MSDDKKPDQELSEEEVAKRRDEGLRRLLKMKSRPHIEVVHKRKIGSKSPLLTI